MKKVFTTLLLIGSFLVFNNQTAKAFSYPKPVAAMNQILSNLGVNKDELKNTIKTANVARYKKTAPEVKVSFSPTNPVEGEKVTANAAATYFMNDASEQYYTWFLKHEYCDKDENKDRCDLNDDDKVDIEDYKIEAARIIANSGFNYQDVDYGNHNDDDGFDAPMGGRDQKGKNAHCYIHDFNKGADYELEDCEHLFPDTNGNGTVGDGKFGSSEEKFWHTDPLGNDTAGTGNNDEANVSGLGQYQFTWTYQSGDELGVAVEGVSIEPTQYDDSSFKTMWALPKNTCDTDEDDLEEYFDESTFLENETISESEIFTYCGQADNGKYKHDGVCTSADSQAGNMCGSSKNEDCNTLTGEKETQTIYRRTKTTNSDNTVTITTYTTIKVYRYESDGTSLIEVDGSAEAGFVNPEVTTEEQNPITTETLKVKTGSDTEVATSSCRVETTSPGTSTIDLGITFQSNQDWKKTVEAYTFDSGTLQKTKRTYNYIYYYQSNNCSGTPIKKLVSTTSDSDSSSSYDMKSSDLNDCLEKNLLSPSEQSVAQKINVDLSYSPKNPVNDTDESDNSGDNADKLILNASATGANNEDALKYEWKVYKSDKMDISSNDNWEIVPAKNLSNHDQSVSLTGVGLSNIKFDLKFSDAPKYLKVNLKVSEKINEDTVRQGVAETYIKLSNTSDSIKISRSQVEDMNSTDNKVAINVSNEICKKETSANSLYGGLKYLICPVTKLSLLRLELSNANNYENFSWTVNGKSIDDNKAESSCTNCKSRDNLTGTFLPILGNKGSAYVVKLNATNKKTGENVSFTRNLEVVDPSIDLTCDKDDPNDEYDHPCFAQSLGSYIDPTDNTKTYPDLSRRNFDAVADTKYEFFAYFNAPIPKESDYYWTFDGKKITHGNGTLLVDGAPIDWATEKADPTNEAVILTVDTEKYNEQVLKLSTTLGKSFRVSVNANFKSETALNKELVNDYSIGLNQFEGKFAQKSINVNVSYANDKLSFNNLRQRLTASLINSLPGYTLFVLRLSITVFLIMFAIAFGFSLTAPNKKE